MSVLFSQFFIATVWSSVPYLAFALSDAQSVILFIATTHQILRHVYHARRVAVRS